MFIDSALLNNVKKLILNKYIFIKKNLKIFYL